MIHFSSNYILCTTQCLMFNSILLCRHTIECVFYVKYVKVIIDLVRDGNVDAPFLAIQHRRLQVCAALTHGRH